MEHGSFTPLVFSYPAGMGYLVIEHKNFGNGSWMTEQNFVMAANYMVM